MKRTLIAIVVLSSMIVAGCQVVSNFYPTEISPTAAKYAGRDPNSIKWYDNTLRTAKRIKEEAINKHIGEQLNLDFKMRMDQEKYQQALEIIDRDIAAAEAERDQLLGTLQNPGWLLMGLMTLLPIGSYVAGWRTLWPSHYTQQEVDAEIAKAKSQAGKTA